MTLLKGSLAIDIGMDVGDMGMYDFFGNLIPTGGTSDIGVYEVPELLTSDFFLIPP